ncbi:MAG: helix-turn-helix domain-containing protein [Magnetospirillum sp.]|nr:helix-turn-helix domain-containing protein [Magnetospirillum sp.]
MEGLGEKLRARARELGLSDTEVARRLDISQSRYANYVVDKREPDFATFIRICRVLGTTPDVLLGYGALAQATSEDERLQREIGAAALSMRTPALRTLAEVANALAARRQEDDNA